ncbi:type II toxin-antitoxin system ParD family antitoxin [Acidiphilium sp. PA]|uniref:type II toxin-antitoxin system ParD family antitoxin n=1 Tax=Acidiphilium sp. PA TaxID=2871705 RepID=UPI002243067E|nr:type II toxin-antitoxin system ParD family antitoxin [Acidiphilium sp. PA]MCW8308224.1 type II toxin-antitoxin system ParD family antitoxin [Acidiphilium sp. PA]
MTTMNISLPDDLKRFVDERQDHGYGTSSEYIRELIRRDRDRLALRALIVEGLESGSAGLADARFIQSLRGYAESASEPAGPKSGN